MLIYKTIKDFFEQKTTMNNKREIIKIGNRIYKIKEITELEMFQFWCNPYISLCESFCDLEKECTAYSKEKCKLNERFFLQKK